MRPASEEITRLLAAASRGSREALNVLVPLVYEEIRQLARHALRDGSGHTLQTTALAHEAYLRLVGVKAARWETRAQFFAYVGSVIRSILVDHARSKQRIKRGGRVTTASLDAGNEPFALPPEEVIALDEALRRLQERDDRKRRVVELRFFAGLTVEETAATLSVSTSTVERDFDLARAWLRREILGDRQNGSGPMATS